ncbi:type I inositol polyphosphate 5-phosphatase 5-like [Magnolia sinica]|uniref:type I inositol polyphosphate 5-phosphatase 5-like n=1 Tax=Magnolia sinica TaxID=86752 RepID=UPI00265B6A5E|nr:type I inositol polyphosphate 5-phosphatase 5-like [Magnolia sinica]
MSFVPQEDNRVADSKWVVPMYGTKCKDGRFFFLWTTNYPIFFHVFVFTLSFLFFFPFCGLKSFKLLSFFETDIERRRATSRARHFNADPMIRKSFSERQTSSSIQGLNLCNFDRAMDNVAQIQDLRIFVATWNVGGRSPNNGLNLEDFLQAEGSSDIYVVGFQEIVPLNAGNVLVIEDNEPAAKWLTLISQALNRPTDPNRDNDFSDSSANSESNSARSSKDSKAPGSSSSSGLLFFQKPSLKVLSRNFRVDGLKTCNCNSESPLQQRGSRELGEQTTATAAVWDDFSEDDTASYFSAASEFPSQNHLSYCLIASKQMVGIFLSVWVRNELVPHIGHLRVSSVGRGIMGCLGNKGCISVSITLHQTSFCFVCCHLASGEKEGDELRRNADVAEILKNTQFPKICKAPTQRIPERILDHDRVIWLGDLNYRIALNYAETRELLEDNHWDALLERDQLRIEMEASRVFRGFQEGKIFFAPTYKYSRNSDAYAGETSKSKKKRRTPAWCDRILWYGDGIEQQTYIRGESRFSDHRPVCAVFVIEVEMHNNNSSNDNNNKHNNNRGRNSTGARIEMDGFIPHKHTFHEY